MRTRGITTIVAAALVTMALVIGPTTSASASLKIDRAKFLLRLMNRSRERHGLRALKLSSTFTDYAYRHSRDMCDADTLYHSTTLDYSIQSDTSATYWGENIAMAPSIREVFKLWMHSAPHRHNILFRHYRRGGVGVYLGRGYFWATVDFYGW